MFRFNYKICLQRIFVNIVHAGLLITCAGVSAQANIVVKNGWNTLRSDTINLTSSGTSTSNWVFNAFGQSQFNISDNMDGSCGAFINLKTINGYTGKEIAPGVLLVIYTSTITAQGKISGKSIQERTVTWDASGKVSTTPSVAPFCYDVRTAGNFLPLDMSVKLTTKGTIRTGIYVSPGAVMNGVIIPKTYVTRFDTSNSGYLSHLLSSSNLVIDVNPSSCTLFLPATVPFDTVADNRPKTVQQSISVNCTGTENAYDVSYKMTSKSGAATKTTLPMNNIARGTKVADVRGFLGDEGADDAGCADKNSSVLMNGTLGLLKTGASKGVNEIIPMAWVLCPLEAAEPGPASATASMEITW